MFRCHACGERRARREFVSEVFRINGKHVLVEDLPALICERCGEATFSKETTEKVRKCCYANAE